MKTQYIIDTLKLANQYLGKAVAENLMPNTAIPVENAMKQVIIVINALEKGEPDDEEIDEDKGLCCPKCKSSYYSSNPFTDSDFICNECGTLFNS